MTPEKDLTEDILLQFGFIKVDNKWPNSKHNWMTFRKKVEKRPDPYGYFAYDIQVEISNLPNTNPNSGIVSLYHEAFDCPAIPEDLHDKKEWTDEDRERVNTFTVHVKEKNISIAHFINTEERLKHIYEAITLTKLTKTIEGELEDALKREDFERVIEIKKQLNEK